MLYRLCPPAHLTWCDMPGRAFELLHKQPEADLDRLPWTPAESRVFSDDLLRIAVRHGVASRFGIVLDVRHTVDLGRADELRAGQIGLDEAMSKLRASQSMQLLRLTFPESHASDRVIDEGIRRSTEKVAQEAEEDLAEVLEHPVQHALVEHWTRLGGRYPD